MTILPTRIGRRSLAEAEILKEARQDALAPHTLVVWPAEMSEPADRNGIAQVFCHSAGAEVCPR